MQRALERALRQSLGSEIRATRPLAGGDINQAFEVELGSGARAFLKTNDDAPPEMFPAEAAGLEFLREAGALRIPEVLAVSGGDDETPGFLVLELLISGRRVPDFDERLGGGLAELHRLGAPSFGLSRDNFIGSLPQSNHVRPSWPEFYWSERLEPQLAQSVARGLASPRMRAGFERLAARLAELVGPDEPPARLHGDLWGGNLHVDAGGQPCLIDPAVYGGQREVDLAMMQLFGGFGPRVHEAYAEAYPLSAGHAERVALYQLYPLLVHVNLFGSGYVSAVERGLARYV